MKKLRVRNCVVVFTSLAMVHAVAAPAAIGIATAKGSFRVDDSYVAGNATLFEGASVETGTNTGELNLSKARVAMAAETRGRVFQDRMILDRGKVQWGGTAFRTLVGELQIVGANDASKALVTRKGEGVQVASLSGTVNVLSASGEMLMAVAPGMAFDFNPEPQGASPGDKTDPSTPPNKNKKKKAAAAGLSTGAKVGIGVGVAAAAGGVAAGVVATRGGPVTNILNLSR
jgi:hypothetical protein